VHPTPAAWLAHRRMKVLLPQPESAARPMTTTCIHCVGMRDEGETCCLAHAGSGGAAGCKLLPLAGLQRNLAHLSG
jgi:hypothetical protein